MVGYGAREVTFESGGSTIAAVFYRPNRPGRHPCVVMAHGFSGTMDWILPDFAAVFAAAGFGALTFDYRHFGASEGQLSPERAWRSPWHTFPARERLRERACDGEPLVRPGAPQKDAA